MILLLAIAGLRGLEMLAADPEDPDVGAVGALAVDTLVFEHRMGIAVREMVALSPAGDVDRIHAAAEAAARARYGGSLLETRIRQVIAAADLQAGGEQSVLDGGASDIVISAITIDGDRATVHLVATTWVVMTAPGRPVSSPTSRDHWTFLFEEVDGRWLVTDVDCDFRG